MYNPQLHQLVNSALLEKSMDLSGKDNLFYTRFIANTSALDFLYSEVYAGHPDADFSKMLNIIIQGYIERPEVLKQKDLIKEEAGNWFLSNKITGMSLYVDRFNGSINGLQEKLPYLKELGVNLLHVMPVMESPQGESDGGYAVADFKKVDQRFGSLDDLQKLQQQMQKEGIYLMMDIVLNHTSHQHEWAQKAKQGDKYFQDFFYMYPDRSVPDDFETTMPEIFPEAAPGNFTFSPECKKWVMTVFHNYQWDLNYRNPEVFLNMLELVFFYANLGIDILRIDAPAFIWKERGTNCQNLPQAHNILKLIKQCIQVAAPGMALLGEAIVAPKEIMKYFGSGFFTAKECDFAYNATQMALQWDALATADTRVMLAAQHDLLQKPFGTSWITYARCHDDIGLGYDDYMITNAGYNAYEHRKFLKEYYSGAYNGSPAKGALFSVNPKTQDARISGTLASLCGLEKANGKETEAAIRKILLMQAFTFFIGGVPMLFYGDEVGYTNDYSYLNDSSKSYDNRWMHRPLINWKKNEQRHIEGTIEARIFSGLKQLIKTRHSCSTISDHKNLTWLHPYNASIAGYLRSLDYDKIYCFFNFSAEEQLLPWTVFHQHGPAPSTFMNLVTNIKLSPGEEHDQLSIEGYGFLILQALQ